MTLKIKTLGAIAGTCILLSVPTACRQTAVTAKDSAYILRKDTVYVKDDALLAKIVVTEVTTEPYSKETVTAGTVQPIPTQIAYIAPPFSGRVVKSHVHLGQTVRENTPLFDIISPDFTAIQKEFFQAKSNRELAQKDLKRKEDLEKNGVGSQKEMEEALNAMQIAEKEYENVCAALKIYQMNPDKMALGEPLTIRSPLSGEVITNTIVTGQYINSDSEPVATIADLSKVWISAQVKEKDIRFIHKEDEMNITIAAYPEYAKKGTLFHIDEAVDEATRSINVLSLCENKEGLLKLGMYTTVYFVDQPVDCIAIPEKALLQDEKNSYVLTETARGVFVKKPVTVDVTKNGKAIIVSGIRAGDRIMCEGGYYFK